MQWSSGVTLPRGWGGVEGTMVTFGGWMARATCAQGHMQLRTEAAPSNMDASCGQHG